MFGLCKSCLIAMFFQGGKKQIRPDVNGTRPTHKKILYQYRIGISLNVLFSGKFDQENRCT